MSPYIHPLQQQSFNNRTIKQSIQENHSDFKTILSDLTTLKISKHAQARMAERKISISNESWQQLTEKLFEAKQKGVTDALVVMDDATLIVSTKNNTVVTALHKTDADSRIFTNINGTILL